MVPEHVELGAGIHGRISAERRAFFTTTAGRPLSGRTVRQAMVSPLIGESGLIGSMTVANRLTEGTTFDDDDLRLLETLANQAAVALENGQLEQSLAELSRLKEQLRHQAYHDPLTGLANRAMFAEQVDAQLGARRPGLDTVVLFLDLDDFKIVNDTLGHAAGDRLLRVVAERINGCVRADDLAARLGGDEFAVLLLDDPEPRPLAGGRPPDHRGAAGAVPDRRPGDRGRGEHRDRGHEPGRRHGRRAAAQRRRRDVHGQGRREAPRGGVRADDARCARRASCAVGGAVAEPRARRAGRLLPADRAAGRRADGRRRGARPLAPPDPRAHPARRVHRAGRGDGTDPRARPLGPCRVGHALRRLAGAARRGATTSS